MFVPKRSRSHTSLCLYWTQPTAPPLYPFGSGVGVWVGVWVGVCATCVAVTVWLRSPHLQKWMKLHYQQLVNSPTADVASREWHRAHTPPPTPLHTHTPSLTPANMHLAVLALCSPNEATGAPPVGERPCSVCRLICWAGGGGGGGSREAGEEGISSL